MNRCLSLIGLMLLVMPPLSAQSPQPGWIADMKTGCRVWNSFPLPGETITWTGLCQNDLAQGHGVLQWFGDGQPMARYEGELRDGKMNGRGHRPVSTLLRDAGLLHHPRFNNCQ